MDQAGGRRGETAGLQVEGSEFGSELDVEPLASGGSRLGDRTLDELGPDAAVLVIAARLRVEEEGVVAAVPSDVHETEEESVGAACGDPAETEGLDLIPPPGDGRPPEETIRPTISSSETGERQANVE